MKFSQVFLIIPLLILSCGNTIHSKDTQSDKEDSVNNNGKFLTGRKIIKYILAQDSVSLFATLDRNIYSYKWRRIIDFKVNRANDLLNRYGVPSENKWYLKYDTTSPIIKLAILVIPICKGYDSLNNDLEEASLELGFDKSGNYLPDTILANFDILEKHRP